MATIQELVARFKADTAQFDRKIKNVQKETKQTGKEFATATSKAKIWGAAIGAAVSAAAIAVAAFAVKVGSAMDQSEKRLQALLGSTTKATKVLTALRQSGYDTGASVLDLANNYTKLAVFVKEGSISMGESLKISKGLTSASSVLGVTNEQLSQVMYGFAQAMGSGTLRAEEFNQVTDPLPSLLQRMEQKAGLAAGELRKMVNEGKVTSEQFKDFLIPALQSFTEEAGKMATTLQKEQGKLENTFQAIGEDIYDYLEKPMIKATKAVDAYFQQYVSVARASNDELGRRLEENAKRIEHYERFLDKPKSRHGSPERSRRMIEKIQIEQQQIRTQLFPLPVLEEKPKIKEKPTIVIIDGGGGRTNRTISKPEKKAEAEAETFSTLEPLPFLPFPTDEITTEIDLISTATDQLQTSVISSFLSMSQSGKASFKEMARSIINDLQAVMLKTLAMQAITGLVSAAGGAFFSGGASEFGLSAEFKPTASTTPFSTTGFGTAPLPIGNTLAAHTGFGAASIPISGAKASGGSVMANKRYLVGEKGAEILTLGNTSGHITSNKDAFGGGQQAPIIQIDARGSERGVAQEIKRVLNEVMMLKNQVPQIALTAFKEQNGRIAGGIAR